MNFLSKYKFNRLKKRVKILYDKRERGDNVDVRHEIKANKELGKFYQQHQFDKAMPHAAIHAAECYRAAANLGDAEAQYLFGQLKLEQGRFWDQFSQGIYALPIHQEYAKDAYEEALEQLQQAAEKGNYLALRLYGLVYINGWGVVQDKDKGFKMVVQSIDEAKAWDKATQIFEELGLNTPEFFSSIMAVKSKR
jgi:TPR repeat protein